MLASTVFSVLLSCVMSYGMILALYGVQGALADAEPLMLLLPIAVPALVAPIATLQLATTLATAAAAIDDLEAARLELVGEVAARKAAQLELEFLASRDPLTGLLNRRGFFDALDRLPPERFSNLVLATADVDRFKAVNDTLGHAVGDDVLRAVAERLEAAAGATSLVARLGGDEFVAAITSGAGGDRVRSDLVSFDVHGVDTAPLRVSCSVGVAAHSTAVDIDATLARADAALYRDKARHIIDA